MLSGFHSTLADHSASRAILTFKLVSFEQRLIYFQPLPNIQSQITPLRPPRNPSLILGHAQSLSQAPMPTHPPADYVEKFSDYAPGGRKHTDHASAHSSVLVVDDQSTSNRW